MYVLGAVLVLAGISQIVNLSAARSWTVVPGGFFVIPVLVLIAGIVVLFNPFTGCCCSIHHSGSEQHCIRTVRFDKHHPLPSEERTGDA